MQKVRSYYLFKFY